MIFENDDDDDENHHVFIGYLMMMINTLMFLNPGNPQLKHLSRSMFEAMFTIYVFTFEYGLRSMLSDRGCSGEVLGRLAHLGKLFQLLFNISRTCRTVEGCFDGFV